MSIYDWCVAQVQAAGSFNPSQRGFRFEFGRYTGSWPIPGFRTVGALILEGLIAGAMGAQANGGARAPASSNDGECCVM